MGAVASFFLGGWNLIKMGFSAIGKFLGSLNAQGWIGLIVALLLGWTSLHFWGEARHFEKQSARYLALYTKTKAALDRTVAAYTKAQADAQAKNLATVAADKAERERITNDISQSYEAQLAGVRADLAKRLRAKAGQSHPDQSGLPEVSIAANGPDGSARLSIPTDLYVRGAELEVQLDQLQQWVKRQMTVDPNGKQ